MSMYDNYISGSIIGAGTAQVLGVLTKNVGNTISVQVTFTNTGSADWTYGIGLTLKDANGSTWNCWTGNNIKTVVGNEGSIDSHFCAKNATVTHTISGVPVTSDMASGPVTLVVALWRESTAPPSVQLSRYPTTGWASTDSNGTSITINNPASYMGTITGIVIS